MEILDLFGIIFSIYLGYVNEFFSLPAYASVLPTVMNFQRQNNVVLPKTQINITTTQTHPAAPFWQHIVLMITDSWFFSWLAKDPKVISTQEKILIEKNIHKSRYSRVI